MSKRHALSTEARQGINQALESTGYPGVVLTESVTREGAETFLGQFFTPENIANLIDAQPVEVNPRQDRCPECNRTDDCECEIGVNGVSAIDARLDRLAALIGG